MNINKLSSVNLTLNSTKHEEREREKEREKKEWEKRNKVMWRIPENYIVCFASILFHMSVIKQSSLFSVSSSWVRRCVKLYCEWAREKERERDQATKK